MVLRDQLKDLKIMDDSYSLSYANQTLGVKQQFVDSVLGMNVSGPL